MMLIALVALFGFAVTAQRSLDGVQQAQRDATLALAQIKDSQYKSCLRGNTNRSNLRLINNNLIVADRQLLAGPLSGHAKKVRTRELKRALEAMSLLQNFDCKKLR